MTPRLRAPTGCEQANGQPEHEDHRGMVRNACSRRESRFPRPTGLLSARGGQGCLRPHRSACVAATGEMAALQPPADQRHGTWRARCSKTGTPGSAGGDRKTHGRKAAGRPVPDPTEADAGNGFRASVGCVLSCCAADTVKRSQASQAVCFPESGPDPRSHFELTFPARSWAGSSTSTNSLHDDLITGFRAPQAWAVTRPAQGMDSLDAQLRRHDLLLTPHGPGSWGSAGRTATSSSRRACYPRCAWADAVLVLGRRLIATLRSGQPRWWSWRGDSNPQPDDYKSPEPHPDLPHMPSSEAYTGPWVGRQPSTGSASVHTVRHAIRPQRRSSPAFADRGDSCPARSAAMSTEAG